ncbi:MAG: phosphoribosyltransferase family protein, partial [Candidatus Zixiibacteriota bacterium]
MGQKLGEYLANIHRINLEKLKIDYIVPIPLHSHRMKARGFNQAELMADIICKIIGVKKATGILTKIKKTKDQARLGLSERLTNIKGSFAVEDDSLMGKRVMIIDDVITTGATIDEARRVLKEAGSIPVALAAAAIAGN